MWWRFDAGYMGERDWHYNTKIEASNYYDIFNDTEDYVTVTFKGFWTEAYTIEYDQNLGNYSLQGDWFKAGKSNNLEWNPITVSGSLDPDKWKIGKRNNDINY